MFETHKLNDKGFKAMNDFKEKLSLAVSEVMLDMPECREKALFKTKVEEAVFFGAKAIASSPDNYTEIFGYAEVGKVI
jgi:hypothetical protein